MPLATLSERLEFDADQRANWWPSVARDPAYSLVEKFDIINMSIGAEPLGECRLPPLDPHVIYSFLPYESEIYVHFEVSVVGNYRLPANYAMMVSRRDIAMVNSQIHRYTLTRAVKHCDWLRIPFDDKPYTFELVLKQLPRGVVLQLLPRKPSWPGVPLSSEVSYMFILLCSFYIIV